MQAGEIFRWVRCLTKFVKRSGIRITVLKIAMSPVHLDIASPAVTNTIHEAANDGGRPWKSLHVQGSKEDGLCLSSRERNGGSGISILCLRDLIFRTEPEETRTPPSTQKSNSGLGDHDQESCHASTGSHTAGIYLVFRLGDPGTHAKLGHHLILVV